MKLHIVLVAASTVFACLLNNMKCEVFTAMSDVEKLLNTEILLTESLEKYIRLEEERITKLKNLNRMYAKMYHSSQNDRETFLSNPVNAFLLVKHLTSDWNMTKKLIDNSQSQEVMSDLLLRNGLFPNEEDLQGAAESLMRLQQFYLLDASTLAHGHIKGLVESPELTASDCFELGKRAYDLFWSKFSLMWMQEALKRLDSEEIYDIDRTKVMEYIAYSAYEVGNFSFGLNVTEEITKLDPNYTRLYDNLKYYQAKIAEKTGMQDVVQEYQSDYGDIDVGGKIWSDKEIQDAYEKLCREDSVQMQEVKNKLHCYYETNNDGYLLLGPIKVEILSFDPRIVVFHGVMTDREIDRIKAIAAPQLERAVVQDTISGKIEPSTDRISKSTTFEDYHHKIIARISKRIQDISCLTVKTAEPIDIINYGIGGHYVPHFDYAQTSDKVETFHNKGNRIATWIFYMSDVTAGGHTVFPLIGVKVKPVKGSAGFWYNLKANGDGDQRMFHAACPVLSGSKWVGNKWLHEYGNEFRRPCNLNSEK